MKKMRIILSALLVLAMALPCLVLPASAKTKQEISTALDFSSASGYNEVAVGDLFKQLLDIELTDNEKTYFETNDIALRYNQTVTAADVTCVSDNTGITVTVKSKSYKAANGATVVWTPVSVELDGTAQTPKDNVCTFEMGTVSQSGYYDIKVSYKAEIKLAKSDLQAISDYCYDMGTAAQKLKDDYTKLKGEYDAALQLYNSAKADYNTKLDVYNQYLADYAAYQKDLAAYNDYVTKKALYDQQYQAWATYSDRRAQYEADLAQYTKDYEQYGKDLEAYNAYLAAAAEANKVLTAFNSVFVSDSVGRNIHGTLNGSTVATVVDKKADLVKAGANGNDVDNADKATKALKALTNSYAALTDSKAKFDFYKANYKDILDNFTLLFSSLSSLFANPLVRKALNNYEKFERFQLFISQLYVITTSLDDAVTRDEKWVVMGVRTTDPSLSFKDLVEAVQIVPDTNTANPASMTYPTVVEAPTEPVKPTEPDVVTKPEKTWTVEYDSEPVAPKEVAKPTEPKKSDYVGTEPTSPELSADEIKFAKDISDGVLKKRTVSQDATYELKTNVNIKYYKSNKYSVIFYDSDKTTVLYETTVEDGGTAVFSGKTPTKAATKKLKYEFAGWTDIEGKAAKLDNITSSMYYYASYTETAILYTIKWTVNGKTTKEQYKYGETPTPPSVKQSYESDGFTYAFEGWSPAIATVTEDAAYTANYSSTAGTFTITFKIGDKTYTQQVLAGTYPTPPDFDRAYILEGNIYTFKEWNTRITRVRGDQTYTAVFEQSQIATLSDGSTPDVGKQDGTYIINTGSSSSVDFKALNLLAATDKSAIKVIFAGAEFDLGRKTSVAKINCNVSGTTCKIELFDSEGKEPTDAGCQIALLASAGISEAPAITYNGVSVATSLSDGYIWFSYCGNGEYTTGGGNNIYVHSSDNGMISVSASNAAPGELVSFTATPNLGYELESVQISYVLDGKTYTQQVGNSFTMPNSDVTVTADFKKCVYTVKFTDYMGNVISEAEYGYGDTPIAPENPTKPDESNISFAFSGWTPTLMPVTRDITYAPIFTPGIKGTSEDTYTSPYDSNLLFGTILPIALGVLAVAAIAVIILIISKKKRENAQK